MSAYTRRTWRIVFSIVVGSLAVLLMKLATGPTRRTDSVAVSPHLEIQRASAETLTNGGTYTLYLPSVSYCCDTRVPPFSIQFYGTLNASNGLTRAVDAGARWIRVPILWTTIEPTNTTPEHYDWSGLDESVTNAVQEGVELMLTLGGQPSWAATYPMGPLTDTADVLEFVGALVERYDGDEVDDAPGSPRVRYLELYNEPDNTSAYQAMHGWGIWGENGDGYAALLQELYPAIKAANPGAQLVFGGLALDWFKEQGGPFDSHFLDDVLAACQGQHCFDVMNFHYYPPFRPNWESYGTDIIGKANYVRERLAVHGFIDVPVICTETSWASATSTGWGSDELQSRYVVKGYVRGMAARLDVIVWYQIRDQGDTILPGLLDNERQPKPSYRAYQAMTDMLAGALYQRPLTLAEAGSDQVEGYVFQACGGRLDVVWTEDGTPYDPDDDPVRPLIVRAQTVRVVDKFGNEIWYDDADDGKADGRTIVSVGGSPLYLEYDS
jgi:hypothetical protein